MASGQKPIAKFSVSAESLSSTENKIKFLSTSLGNPTSISWHFPEGIPSTSTMVNPMVTYSKPGTYKAELTITNSEGTSIVSAIFSTTSEKVIYLSTGKNDDGSLITSNPRTPDTKWWYTAADGTSDYPVTRVPRSGWSLADLKDGIYPNSVWFATKDAVYGVHTYTRNFTLPKDGKLNLRSTATNRNWVYLVEKKTDGTEIETKIVETEHQENYNDQTWSGYYNSWNPNVLDYPIKAGNYELKVVIENFTNYIGGMNLNSNIKYQDDPVFNPVAAFAGPDKACLNKPVKFTADSLGNPTSYSWVFKKGSDSITASGPSPEITFTAPGKYDGELTVTYTNGQTSTLSIDKYIELTDCDLTRAPNSYIFDINKDEYSGLYIPTTKAYAMWQDNEYLKNESAPTGSPSVSVYWEDVAGLIESVDLEGDKIKVMIDKLRGKGNAVIALHSGSNGNHKDPVLWSWHVWVTDDPSDGVKFGHGFTGDVPTKLSVVERNIDDDPFLPTFMDRNLGATSNHILGHEWNRSGGLMYQWGRKDPFPPLTFLDYTYYDVSGSFNDYDIPLTWRQEPTRHKKRQSNEINKNIAYSVLNPFTYIDPVRGTEEESWHWFAAQKFKETDNNGLPVNYDLWGDATKGKYVSGGIAPYQLKSPFDPCPNGWRVPSYRHQVDRIHYKSPWGRGDNGEDRDFGDFIDKIDINKNPFNNSVNYGGKYNGLKLYPGIGYDFSGITGKSYRNIGQFPFSGAYYDYFAFNGGDSIIYQDNNYLGTLWGASLNGAAQASHLRLIFDEYEKLYIGSWDMTGTYMGYPLRCMRDPNLLKIGDFPTQYIESIKKNYKEGLENPNTYLVKSGQTEIEIPVNKAYAVYNQYLSKNGWPQGSLSTNIYWTTNKQLIESVSLNGSDENAKIKVKINSAQKGNTIISLHIGANENSNDPVLWSWHIWVPNGDPETNTIIHRTETPYQNLGDHLVNPTNTGLAPLSTEFMDRNLGAIEMFPLLKNGTTPTEAEKAQVKLSHGLQYQWGRKDPIPSFQDVSTVYKGSNTTGVMTYTDINNDIYNTNYTKPYSDYSVVAQLSANDKKAQKISKILEYSVNNPFNFMYSTGLNYKGESSIDWISNENGWAPDRWGHANKKSPFDPCPSGWRVPDTYYVQASNDRRAADLAAYTDRGNSLWYNGDNLIGTVYGTKQDSQGYLSSNYNGRVAPGNLGLIFDRKDDDGNGGFTRNEFRIGGYPFSGIRGNSLTYRKEVVGGIFGLWSSSITTHDTYSGGVYLLGRPLAAKGYLSPATFASGRTSDSMPQTAMNVRCARDEPRYIGITRPSYFPPSLEPITAVAATAKVTPTESILSESNIQIYPNPNSGVFKILVTEFTSGTVQIVNSSGTVVFSGLFKENTEVDINM